MSDFSILTVRSGESEDSPHYPIPGEVSDSVELEQEDGQPLARLTATEMTVLELTSGKPRRIVHVEKMKAAVFITDARVAVACSKFDKGGGWVPWSLGAIPVAIAANATSKVRASRRRRGKMLVGHTRYPQLRTVGFSKTGLVRQREQLRLSMADPTVGGIRVLALDLTLAGGSRSAATLSRDIVSRAAAHRLDSSEELDEPIREHLEGLQDPKPLQPEGNGVFTIYHLCPPGMGGP